MRRDAVSWVCLLLLAAVCLCNCSPADPRGKVREQRRLWKVDLLSLAGDGQGGFNLGIRVSGPVRTSLTLLTVRIDMVDADGKRVDEEWRSLDLTEIQRGGPKDYLWKVTPRVAGVEGMSIDTVPDPTPEEARAIKELSAEPGA